jgi:pimeloyl-ACP methyl ester carboxylesterase
MFPHHSLQDTDRLGGIPIPVSFYFGDFDWMYNPGGDIIVNKNPFKGTHSHVYIIQNSDHHMYFDNPEEFAETILNDLSNLKDLEKDKRKF